MLENLAATALGAAIAAISAGKESDQPRGQQVSVVERSANVRPNSAVVGEPGSMIAAFTAKDILDRSVRVRADKPGARRLTSSGAAQTSGSSNKPSVQPQESPH